MTWRGRVEFSWDEGFAHVPEQVLVLGLTAEQEERMKEFGLEEIQRERLKVGGLSLRTFAGARDVPLMVRKLRAAGITAQPNHVMFADACTCCPPHPAMFSACSGSGLSATPLWANAGGGGPSANPLWANPLWANPLWANPLWANPLWANPLWANAGCARPVWAYPVWASGGDLGTFIETGFRKSTAIPVTSGPKNWPTLKTGGPTVIVLDTGYPDGTYEPTSAVASASSPPDYPDQTGPGTTPDSFLDPVAGHGTFIAGLIKRVEPSASVEVRQVVKPEGDVNEGELVDELEKIASNPPILLNLSLSGYAFDDMPALRLAVADIQAAGTVVVASAGNEGSCTPTYPASLPKVVSVGAIGPDGPAPFTNYGPWVRACAPGVGLISTFFNNFDGAETAPPGSSDPDKFSGWAQWSGTSFSAPVVAGAIAHEMVARGLDQQQAVERLIDAPGLMRIPNLGTVVNML